MNVAIYQMIEEVKQDPKHDPANLTLDEYDYSELYREKSGDEKKFDGLPPVEDDEEKYYRIPSTLLSKGGKE